MRFQYELCQLKLVSELYCPELIPVNFLPENADITIEYGSVSKTGLVNPIHKTHIFQAKKEEFWLNIPKVSRFLVTQGHKIVIEPDDSADEASIRLYLLGSCLGALLMQRGLLILHGNAIHIGESVISITGDSGIGKSTLSSSFIKRGYSVLADDICVINDTGEVLPSFPQIKLWANAVEKLHVDVKNLRKIQPHMEKYAVPLEKNFYPDAAPLSLVYILKAHQKKTIELKNIHGFDKYNALFSQIYRRLFVNSLDQKHKYQLNCMRLAGKIEMAMLIRPNIGNSIEELTDFILSDLQHRRLLSK